jgi:phospholipid/cholesterol/gamma-HCH transport system substrate-binding protein
MNRKTLELWVGLFVAAGLLALSMLAFKVGNLATADVLDGYSLYAEFDNIGGLKVKSAVTMAGVRIGRVSGISFDNEKYRAVVKMEIDGRYRNIPADTIALIFTSGLLGDQYIGLEPGGDERFLKDGDRIFKTQNALVLENLIGQVMVKLTEGGDSGSAKKK